MHRPLIGAVALGVCLALAIPAGAIAGEVEHRTDATLNWQAYPGVPGVEMAILTGHPKQPGLYTIRARFAPGTFTRPHFHPETRWITVISGTWWAGSGERFDQGATVPMPAGSYITHPPGMIHFDGARDEPVVVQITGIGPSGTTFIEQ